MRTYGLIGYPLGHSFSARYFGNKFSKEGITDARYQLFELKDISMFPKLCQEQPDLRGLNVTIPHKEAIIPYLDRLSDSAKEIGAINVIKREADNSLSGHNTDYIGFKQSLRNWLPEVHQKKALVLGTGGAAKAVGVALKHLNVSHVFVSRQEGAGNLTYQQLSKDVLNEQQLIINTTPLGMQPAVASKPNLPYHLLGRQHWLYDLVYNPETTAFLQEGIRQGAQVKNGLEMLYAQAEAAWEIWQHC